MTYQYECQGCGRQFEAKLPMTESDRPVPCPTCGSDTRKLISAPAVVLDWYKSESVHDSVRFRPAATSSRLVGAGD
jgi:putative FmdB family regulatory protein